MLIAILTLAAVAAGVTGAWSPCSLSAAETLRGALPRLAFALGALTGGLVTFAGLAALGAAAGFAAPMVAAAVAVAAAAGEAAGARIVPQVRRQVPESWRRVLPLPVAGGAYGVLLGLGWTTFVLTYAVWALAAVCVALGDVTAGLAVGIGFGAGRSVPVLAGLGSSLAERPRWLRRARLADGGALVACAAALAVSPAGAASSSAPVVAADATDPSAAGAHLAWQKPGEKGRLAGPEGERELPGRGPVIAGDRIAWHDGETATIAELLTLAPLATAPVPGATAIATDGERIVHRAPRGNGGEALWLGERRLYSVRAGRQIGRPSMSGSRVAFHVAGRRATRIVEIDLESGKGRRLRSERGAQLLNPTLDGGRLLYVHATATRQKLRIGVASPRRTRSDRTLWSTWPTARADMGREPRRGHHRHYPSNKPPRRPARPPKGISDTLWTTALGPYTAYVTRLRERTGDRLPDSDVLKVALPRAWRR